MATTPTLGSIPHRRPPPTTSPRWPPRSPSATPGDPEALGLGAALLGDDSEQLSVEVVDRGLELAAGRVFEALWANGGSPAMSSNTPGARSQRPRSSWPGI